jgi:hypothetical protein
MVGSSRVSADFTVPGWAGVRDSKLGDASPVLVFKAEEIDALLAGVKAGEFDNRMR